MAWEVVFDGSGKAVAPEPRSNFAMTNDGENIWIFGGTNGIHTLNDFWKFDPAKNCWAKVEAENQPEVTMV